MLLLGPSQSLVASAGHFTLSTLIEHSTMSPNATTSTSRSSSSIDGTVPGVLSSQTSTTTSTRTITTTGATTTITMTLSELSATAGLGTADDL